jgi:G:T/U-mismatch repair DNA glycosylase
MNCEIETHQFLNSWKENLPNRLEQFTEYWIEPGEGEYFGFIPPMATALFLGTFPVPEQRTTGFFYHSDANLFWKILDEISGQDLSRLENRFEWLIRNKLGITDILKQAQRTDARCKSRADIDLKAIHFNNVLNMLIEHESIQDIYLTSGGPSSKSLTGHSAGGWFGMHIRKETSKNIKKVSCNGATLKIRIPILNRDLNLHYLITPAPQDNQLSKYLRENSHVRIVVENFNILNRLSDTKERYKAIQWAICLSKIQGCVREDLLMEIQRENLSDLLMES